MTTLDELKRLHEAAADSPTFHPCPKCGHMAHGKRKGDDIRFVCRSPQSFANGGRQWLDAHGIRAAHVGPTVFYEWHVRDAFHAAMRNMLPALLRCIEAADALADYTDAAGVGRRTTETYRQARADLEDSA